MEFLWEEKNLIEPMLNCVNNPTIAQNDTTNDTKKSVTEKEWNDIGEKKKWTRNCPKCGKEITYKCKKSLKICSGRLCRSCAYSGRIVTEETKLKMKLNHADVKGKNNPNYGKTSWVKGKFLLDEHKNKISVSLKRKYIKEKHHCFNKKRTEEVKRKISISTMNEKNPFYGKKHSHDTIKKFSETRSGKNNPMFGKTHTEETKEKLRVSNVNRIKNFGKTINFNPVACRFIDDLNIRNGWNLQHALNGGEIEIGGYLLDGYDKERNIIFEYDEPHHYTVDNNLKNKDKKRQKFLIDRLNPTEFWRYNEKTTDLKNII